MFQQRKKRDKTGIFWIDREEKSYFFQEQMEIGKGKRKTKCEQWSRKGWPDLQASPISGLKK